MKFLLANCFIASTHYVSPRFRKLQSSEEKSASRCTIQGNRCHRYAALDLRSHVKKILVVVTNSHLTLQLLLFCFVSCEAMGQHK